MSLSPVAAASARHPKPETAVFEYGTAGFRMKAAIMDPVVFRVGLVAALRSRALGGKIVGTMITASHNPEPDNGVKIVEPLGEMLVPQWESLATRVTNAANGDLDAVLAQIAAELKIDMNIVPRVIVARDTRPSGPALVASLVDGLRALNAEVIDAGVLTTPQLHYLTRTRNEQLANTHLYGQPTEDGYFDKLAHAFNKLIASAASGNPDFKPASLSVDGANGVGAGAFRTLIPRISSSLAAEVVNDGSAGALNDKCGADFVKVQQTFPSGVTVRPGGRYASLDGDADRIVYFYADQESKFHLLDGDKIATLAAAFLIDRLEAAGIRQGITIGVVQTAYANGSSTQYLEKVLGVPAPCAKTGVKHLHHEALAYDIGVYFEANGHGTVIFSDHMIQVLDAGLVSANASTRQALQDLRNFVDVINVTVGDAISDLLMVEAILAFKHWSLDQWDAQYTDLPNKQLKVEVPNRALFQTTNAERELTSPAGMQAEINKLVAAVPKGRSFVRPSGTEDVVRVYAEAETREQTDALGQAVVALVRQFAK
ncbi:phosphoglucomutase [Capsaspora owczarzaki ATCC 30864]|uniref:Phosphoacetylglucosamine mutase n=1 Tax=Capsaspora owczarzaki (strain ATCC 30864) TaxID=595528 RepID=A0A0D2X3L0_CAPO3|nr:phosphoglucomutase [Capsaspora owczarzaki ATCC 30864]KJE94494.1 phosphoglucomutase [Capsaspora owczarzaki ATCC 30864]|eukprot:XP_004346813.1 phosphoglucomutase [Capsaspora owczarzaki ATCC 30864]